MKSDLCLFFSLEGALYDSMQADVQSSLGVEGGVALRESMVVPGRLLSLSALAALKNTLAEPHAGRS